MLIFSRYNLVLQAVPKTGSTALEVALRPEADGSFGNAPESKHLPPYRYKRFVRLLLQLITGQDPETFAQIRERIVPAIKYSCNISHINRALVLNKSNATHTENWLIEY